MMQDGAQEAEGGGTKEIEREREWERERETQKPNIKGPPGHELHVPF